MLAPSRKRYWAVLLFALGASLGAIVGEARAQRAVWAAAPINQTNGTTVKMPLKRAVSRSSGLNLTIDTRWSQNYGYRPIEVTVTSPAPAASDRKVLLELHTGWSGPIIVEQEITLPKGSLTASVKVDAPQYQMATPFYYWDVWVDDIKDKDLSLEQSLAWSVMQSGYGGSSGKTFLSMGSASGQRSLVAPNSMEFEVLSLAAAEFPLRWIEYTCFDVITLSMSELRTLSQQNPAAFRAIARWLRAGGQLWVNETGDKYEHVPELSTLLQLPEKLIDPAETSGEGNVNGLVNQFTIGTGWQPIRFTKGSTEGQVATFLHRATGAVRNVRDPDIIAKLQTDPNYSMTGMRFETAGENPATITVPDSSEWFVEQRLGLGNVRAFRQVNDVSLFANSQASMNANAAANAQQGGDPSQMPPSLTASLQTTSRWNVRHGILPDDANIEFANLLVPGVGMAPVREFQVLITLFVLVIGPLNYWLLKRWKRLHLMILTVPLAAAAITLGLFAYAIASDGFETKVRSHSFTTLDQRTGEAACWARLSYYSGLAPGGGLTMPADVALFPIIPSWNEFSAQSYVRGERSLRWEGDEARLTRGWLRSRTPMQYLTIRSRKSPIKLELTPVRDRLRVKNDLGTQVEFVAVADGEGKFWSGEKLEVGKVAFLQPTEKRNAASRFRKLVTTNSPQVPDALSGENSRYQSMQRQQWRTYGQYTAFAGEQSLAANLANEAVTSLAGLSGGPELNLPPRSYVAVTSNGPEVLYGMDGADEEKSFHVIVGQWRVGE
jgi:hypothetical protein